MQKQVFVWKGCIFLGFRASQDKMLFWSHFGGVSGRVLEGFWALLSGFQGFEERSNFEAEVGTRKSGFKDVRGESGGGSGGPKLVNDE